MLKKELCGFNMTIQYCICLHALSSILPDAVAVCYIVEFSASSLTEGVKYRQVSSFRKYSRP